MSESILAVRRAVEELNLDDIYALVAACLEQGFDAAAKIYERAVVLNTNDVDAVFNLNFAKNGAEYIRQIKAALLRGKSSADAAVSPRCASKRSPSK